MNKSVVVGARNSKDTDIRGKAQGSFLVVDTVLYHESECDKTLQNYAHTHTQ
jgi:hypothetical protein